MSGAYTIDSARSLVLSRGWGVLTGDERVRHVPLLAADPRFKPHFGQLGDLLQVFRDLDEALHWLGVAEAKAEILRSLSEAPALPDTD